ncbi:Site-specific recombinase XerD [Belliella buryatensis]|uniref:Site-specific recombinase XerD n=1 Tax=Belliella buryatensis TaxID=1500549 RepID=A0A239BGJ7_9BACT|nr:site-specific integrase [Belliella buryatensis]SNS06478.1 Site-specific recombinase XerD [Belliella buryatensis]
MYTENTQVNLILQTWKPLKNDKFPVVLRVYHDKKRRYYRTGISAKIEEWDEKNAGIIGKPRENKTLQKFLIKAQDFIQKIYLLQEEFDFDLLSEEISPSPTKKRLENIETFWESVIEDLRKEKRHGTADSYDNALVKFKRFLNGKTLYLHQVTQQTFEKFRIYMVQSGQSTNGVGVYLRAMSAVYGRALNRKLVKPEEDPRIGFRIKTKKTHKKAIKKEEVHQLAKLDLSQFPYMEESRDMFLFSYYCQGMNLKDLSMLNWHENIVEDRIFYHRGKTADMFSIYIKEETIGLILEKQKKVLAAKLDAGLIKNTIAKSLVFRIFDTLSEKEMSDPAKITKVRKQRAKVINAHLRKLGETELGFSPSQLKFLTFYAARHTYASVLKSQHAPVTLIAEALGHADIRTTQVYLDSFANTELDHFNDLL